MNNQALQFQGGLFCVVAVVTTALASFLPRASPQAELTVVAVLILLLGVPHGALDTLFAQNLYRLRTAKGWALFTLAYFIPALLVVVVWQMAPLAFLAGFLLISSAHFSGDPAPGASILARIIYGGAIIVLPTLLYQIEVTEIFSFLVGPISAAQITPLLHYLAWFWVAAAFALALQRMQSDALSGLEMLSLALLAVFVPPLIAFTVFFCLMHSARHILRTLRYFNEISPRAVMAATVAPMLLTGIIAWAGWALLGDVRLDVRLIQLVFVGLAALTVPHMAIVERIRLSGWAS